MAAGSGCGERNGGIGHGERGSRTGMARVGGDVQLAGRLTGRWDSGGRAPSGWEWNGSQPCQGATDLLLPGPALGKMQGQPASRAGEPSGQGQGEEPPPEGLGGHDPFAQTDPRRPAGQVMRHHLGGQPGTVGQAALAAKRPDGRWFSPTPYFRSRIAFSISAWRRWSASSSRVSPSRSVMKP